MKNYHLYIFTQEGCKPCEKLKKHVETLPEDQRLEINFVPLRTFNRQRTALAMELKVDLSPTLVVAVTQHTCVLDADDEYCECFEVEVERTVGASAIIENLPSVLEAYTYAIPEVENAEKD